jgi:hypothetical protein
MDKRTEYVERLSAQMVEWDNQIDLLKDRAKSAAPETESDYSSAIAALQLKRDKAAVKLQGISAASDDEWEDLKAGTESVWDEVRTILRDAGLRHGLHGSGHTDALPGAGIPRRRMVPRHGSP